MLSEQERKIERRWAIGTGIAAVAYPVLSIPELIRQFEYSTTGGVLGILATACAETIIVMAFLRARENLRDK